MKKNKEEIPFLWGTATSSHKIEGKNIHNDWWAWEHQGKIDNQERSNLACDHWSRFRDDLRLAASLGCNSYRFSIEWSRIEPKPGEWNNEALDWYEALVAECERNGLVPMATLHHFTSPRWFSERGGFAEKDSPHSFLSYVDNVLDRLGARVPFWIPFNEPMALMVGQYLGGFFPPGEFNPPRVAKCSRNMLKAHVGAYDLIHRKSCLALGPWKHYPRQVGIAHNLIDFQPYRPWHPVENAMAHVFRRFYNRSWLDAITGRKQHFGVTGFIPYPRQFRKARNRKTVDFIGINYYMKLYTCWRKAASEFDIDSRLPIAICFSKKKDTVSDLGWAIHPEGLGRMLRFVKRYQLPIFITENGIADCADTLRSRYLIDHLAQVSKAKAQGVDVRGYFHWSLLYNFEWNKGFAPRFSLYEMDYSTLRRIERSSADTYRKIIASW